MLKKLTKEYIQHFSSKNLSGISEMMLDNFILEDPAVIKIEGKADALNAISNIFNSCQLLSFEADNVYVDGQTTLIEFTLRVDSTILKGVDIIEWNQGKMQHLRAYLDIPK